MLTANSKPAIATCPDSPNCHRSLANPRDFFIREPASGGREPAEGTTNRWNCVIVRRCRPSAGSRPPLANSVLRLLGCRFGGEVNRVVREKGPDFADMSVIAVFALLTALQMPSKRPSASINGPPDRPSSGVSFVFQHSTALVAFGFLRDFASKTLPGVRSRTGPPGKSSKRRRTVSSPARPAERPRA